MAGSSMPMVEASPARRRAPAVTTNLAHAAHLAKRFATSLWPVGPAADDDAWALEQLLPGEAALWRRMNRSDRRHAVIVAHHVVAHHEDDELGDAAGRPVLAAALLHDVGKIDAGIGPVRRALATVVGMVARRDTVEAWSRRPRGVASRIGRYLCHDRIGADLLADMGSDELTIAWAREHHLPPDRWTVPPVVAAALKAADDD